MTLTIKDKWFLFEAAHTEDKYMLALTHKETSKKLVMADYLYNGYNLLLKPRGEGALAMIEDWLKATRVKDMDIREAILVAEKDDKEGRKLLRWIKNRRYLYEDIIYILYRKNESLRKLIVEWMEKQPAELKN